MDQGPLAETIIHAFDGMPGQLQLAARYILDNPHDVALLSMREQARQADVTPATMTRLAKHLGLDGYDTLRHQYAEAVREGGIGFAGRASEQVKSQKLRGDNTLAADMLGSLQRQFTELVSADMVTRLSATARDLGKAKRIFCLGMRSSYGTAWHFHYVLSLFGDKGVMLDGMGGTGTDPIRNASPEDALFVVSVSPYTRATLEVARYAAKRGVPIIALTDSEVAPLAQIAQQVIIVPTESPSFFHTMAPAYAMAETLAVLIAGHDGDGMLDALRQADEHMADFNIHATPNPRSKGR